MDLVSHLERYLHSLPRSKYYLTNRYYLGKDETVSKDQELVWAHCYLISLGSEFFVNTYKELNLHHTVNLESSINLGNSTKTNFIAKAADLITKLPPSHIFDKYQYLDGLLLTDDSLDQKYLFTRCFLAGLSSLGIHYLLEVFNSLDMELKPIELVYNGNGNGNGNDNDGPPPLEDILEEEDDEDNDGESSSEEFDGGPPPLEYMSEEKN